MTEKKLPKRHPLALAVLAVLNLSAVANASVALNATYTQDFDTLITSGSATFVNDSSLSGWYSARTGTGSTIVAGNGSSNAGAFYSFGTGTNTERALGTVGSGNAAVGSLFYGVRFVNNTGSTITALNVSYTGEQWRNSAAAAQTVNVAYQIGAAGLTTGTWTDVNPLDFVSPVTGGTAGALNGNLAANRVAITGTISALNLAPNQEIWLRWSDADHAGSDHGLAIDDLTVIPAFGDSTPTVNLSVSTHSGSEAGTTAVTVTATASAAVTGTQTVDLAVSGTGITSGDYTLDNTTITLPNGGTTGSVTFTVVDDAAVEGSESATLTISNPSAGISLDSTSTQNITIVDNDSSPLPGLSINDVSLNEGNSGTTNYSFTVSLSAPAGAGGVDFDIATADGSATSVSGDYTNQSLTSQTIPAGSSSYTFSVSVNGDTSVETDENFLVKISNVSGASVTDGQATGTIANDDTVVACSATDTPIGQIQGSGNTAALTGTRTVQGVVVGDYEGLSPALRGFYVQNTAANSDNDPATSDALFVFNSNNDNVSLGQIVQVTGTASENQGQTQLSNPVIESCGSTGNITPQSITLPVPAAVAGVDYLERFEGMLVKFSQTLYVTEHFQLGRFGQVVMSSNSRLPQPTNVTAPGAFALAQQAANNLNRIIVDDDLQNQNRDPILFGRGGNALTAGNTLRGGDTATNMTGIMTYTWSGNAASGNAYRLRPVNALNAGVPNFVAANPRPTLPAQVNGTLKVVNANLLNFFNTFANCTNGLNGAATDCRGAENQSEFDRQWPKTVENLVGTGADVIAVNEVENDGYGGNSAIQFLVDKMNAKAGPGTYALIDVDAATGQTNALGTDAIKVGMIYKPAKVTMVGTTAALNTGALGIYQTTSGNIGRSRPSLAQAFEENATGARFIVVANHFKSKGSACSDNISMLSVSHATIDITNDVDTGDGQGNCNKTRTAAAQELVYWLDTDPTGTGDSDILIVGDLNSYAKEDPVTTIKNDAYSNLIESHIGPSGYSYVFDGQWGYLDHALASASLSGQVQDVLEWHINADEPSVLDYNTNFKSSNQLISLYSIDAFRTSDHDPIIVGLDLTAPITHTISGTGAANTLVGTSDPDIITGFAGRDTLTGGGNRDKFVYRRVQDGIDTITDFTVNDDKIVLTSLLQSLGISSANPLTGGYVLCSASGANSVISIDPDAGGAALKRPLVLVKNVACSKLALVTNFIF